VGYTAKSTFFDFRSGAMVYEGDHVDAAVAKGREDLFERDARGGRQSHRREEETKEEE
jgi:hypothetical protein